MDLRSVFSNPPMPTQPLSEIIERGCSVIERGGMIKISLRANMLLSSQSNVINPNAVSYVKAPNGSWYYEYTYGNKMYRYSEHDIIENPATLRARITSVMRSPPAFRIQILNPNGSGAGGWTRKEINLRA